ncbi:interferon-induced very large GTPase 1-like [Antedon mediterranea]|uniref:interferon-induced very large GTPase 1-like n=1 Tax=Antedon mediterranea TaxID=105859 RepID=UPI003AF5BFF7
MASNETVLKPYPKILEIQCNDIEFGELIGHGGTCSVLKGVWKTKKDMPVAIKRLNHFREIEIVTLRKIKADEEKKHIGRNFITEILGVSKKDHMDCMIMEYAANGSLFHYLSQKREQQQLLEDDKFFTWTRQGALAIQYLHELDIIHRDIKSPNFLITDKHNLKVCDFGISCLTDKTVTTTYTGSLPWMAPENFEAFFKGRGSKIKVSKRSDIYSYGVVIWEMRTLLEADKTERVDGMYPLDEMPSKLKDMLHSCWETDRMKRPSILDILQTMQDLSITLKIKVKDFIEMPDDELLPGFENDAVNVEETLTEANKTIPSPRNTEVSFHIKYLKLQKNYPRKLTCEDVFVVSKEVISPEQLSDKQSQIPWYMLQNLIMCNYEGRCFDIEKNQSFSLSSILKEKSDQSNENSKISPIDALVAIFLCCDNFLRQILIEKFSICQLAIPLLVPVTDVEDKQWEMIVWGMSTITKKWKTSSGSSCERSMVVEKLPIVSVLRLGRPKISKSRVVNYVVNGQKHDIFFNYGCKGGNVERKLSHGLLEIAWYLPSQKNTNAFSDALTFINLRGNASDFQLQTQFLTDISTVTIAFVSSANFSDKDASLLESLYRQKGHVIFILDGTPENVLKSTLSGIKKKFRNLKKQVQYLMYSDMNEQRISTDIWNLLVSYFKESKQESVYKSIEACMEVAKRLNCHVDEIVKECSEAKTIANMLLKRIDKEGKQKELPLQLVTVEIGKMKKEQHQLLRKENMQIEKYVEIVKKEIKDLRRKQLQLHRQRSSNCTYTLFRESFKNEPIQRKYFIGFVKIMTDRYSFQKLQPIREEYIQKWTELCDHKQEKPDTSKASLQKMKDKLDELEKQLSSTSVGLEHFNREIGQNYEMLSDLNEKQEEKSQLPKVAAEMLLEGYPIELMDGDAVHVPLTWIEAVFNSLKDQIGNKRMFVLSVLGIQSSGKSTMLNVMFGLQFAVSAGRCTKGIFAQLVSLDTSLKEDTQCDYILVVDTEGLRSPEIGSIEQANYRDNELATLVIGLGDLTIINIMGENPTDMQDTFQIAVHAFMKMDNVNIHPSCLFVHQNVTDVTASDLNTTQKRSMREMLDKITKIAADAENCSEKYKSFSDVIHFQENEHVMYISSLWQGDPPMAAPNPGYSKCILQVKKQVLEFLKNVKPKSVDEFTTLLSDLWKAILCQDFVFSFKNSLEIQAFNALNAEYVKHARTFRRNALQYSHGLQIECKKLTAEKMTEDGEAILDTFLHKLEGDIGSFQSNMASYFEEETKACQWKSKMELQLEDLCKKVKKELMDLFTSIRNKIIRRAEIDANI